MEIIIDEDAEYGRAEDMLRGMVAAAYREVLYERIKKRIEETEGGKVDSMIDIILNSLENSVEPEFFIDTEDDAAPEGGGFDEE